MLKSAFHTGINSYKYCTVVESVQYVLDSMKYEEELRTLSIAKCFKVSNGVSDYLSCLPLPPLVAAAAFAASKKVQPTESNVGKRVVRIIAIYLNSLITSSQWLRVGVNRSRSTVSTKYNSVGYFLSFFLSVPILLPTRILPDQERMLSSVGALM